MQQTRKRHCKFFAFAINVNYAAATGPCMNKPLRFLCVNKTNFNFIRISYIFFSSMKTNFMSIRYYKYFFNANLKDKIVAFDLLLPILLCQFCQLWLILSQLHFAGTSPVYHSITTSNVSILPSLEPNMRNILVYLSNEYSSSKKFMYSQNKDSKSRTWESQYSC